LKNFDARTKLSFRAGRSSGAELFVCVYRKTIGRQERKEAIRHIQGKSINPKNHLRKGLRRIKKKKTIQGRFRFPLSSNWAEGKLSLGVLHLRRDFLAELQTRCGLSG
jgi:hypothetical protein